MGNVIDYVKDYGAYSFLERPFSDEDALVLAQFSYLKLDGAVAGPGGGRPGVTLGEIRHLRGEEALVEDMLFAGENRALFEAMRESPRFQTMQINYYVNRIDLVQQSQFSAVTCMPQDGPVYIAYRGTDETLVGWREDFRLACNTAVRCQELGVEYLNRVATLCSGSLMVGGHSKGGNLAVFAAMHCEKPVRDRIRRIYSLDGPGFVPEIRKSGEYLQISDRIRKIVPRSCMVGMLMEDLDMCRLVESSSLGILQHNAFTWLVREGAFVTAESVGPGRRMAVETVNRWLASLTGQEIDACAKILFTAARESEIERLGDFSGNWRRALRKLVAAFRGADRETRREFHRIAAALFAAAGDVVRGKKGKVGEM